MSDRMYKHMKNTLKDIKNIVGRDDICNEDKIKGIELNLSLLESVECGETVISE